MMKLFTSLKNQATSFIEPYKQQSPATLAAAEQAIGGVLILDGLIGIENPFGQKKRPGIFGTLAGIILGTVFMFIPTFIGGMTGINDMTATTTATITNVENSSDNSCSVKAKYTVSGKEYIKSSAISSSGNCSLSVGKEIAINYNPNNPSSWSNDGTSMIGFLQIFFWAGLLGVITSMFTFVVRLLSIIFGWKLLKEGRSLAATLPKDTNFQTIINEIKQNFIKTVFNR